MGLESDWGWVHTAVANEIERKLDPNAISDPPATWPSGFVEGRDFSFGRRNFTVVCGKRYVCYKLARLGVSALLRQLS